MADWVASSHCGFRPYRNPASAPFTQYYQASTCASTATIRQGQVVTNNTVVSTGGFRVVRAPSSGGNGANLLEVAITSLIGVAAESDTSDGSTTGLATFTNRRIGVWHATDETEFIGYLKGNGPANSSMIGTNKAVIFDSTLKIHMIDSTNSTAALVAVVITDIPDHAIGDTGGPVVFRFLSSNISPVVR